MVLFVFDIYSIQPKIYFGTRTHKQIGQIVRELQKTLYKDTKYVCCHFNFLDYCLCLTVCLNVVAIDFFFVYQDVYSW